MDGPDFLVTLASGGSAIADVTSSQDEYMYTQAVCAFKGC